MEAKTMDKYNTLGSRIKKLRQSLSLSQAELAKQIHCTQATLSHYESGNREPGLQELVHIAIALKTSTDYLLGVTHIKSVDTDVKMIGNFLGLTEESIKTLHNSYMEHKKKLSEDYLKKETYFLSNSVPGDENYEREFSFCYQSSQLDFDNYVKFINEFLCSPAFRILSHRLRSNLHIECSVYDLLRIAARQYDKIESPLLEADMSANAYALADQSEDLIKQYSLNMFDIQTAIQDFCKNFTKLEDIKELEYQESFYRKLTYSIFHYTQPMFANGKYSFEKLDEAMAKDEFQLGNQAIELLNKFDK